MPFLSLLLYRQNVSSNPLAFFKIFFFFNLSCLVFSSCLHLWFDVMNLRKYCVITVTKISSIPFYELSSGFPITCSFTFCNCPTVFIYSVFFFSSMFSLYFSVLEVFMEISSSLEKFSSVMSTVLIKAPKAFFHQRHCHLSSVYLNCSLSF